MTNHNQPCLQWCRQKMRWGAQHEFFLSSPAPEFFFCSFCVEGFEILTRCCTLHFWRQLSCKGLIKTHMCQQFFSFKTWGEHVTQCPTASDATASLQPKWTNWVTTDPIPRARWMHAPVPCLIFLASFPFLCLAMVTVGTVFRKTTPQSNFH